MTTQARLEPEPRHANQIGAVRVNKTSKGEHYDANYSYGRKQGRDPSLPN